MLVRKAICLLLTPVEKLCDLMVARPWTSLLLLFSGILCIGYLGYVRVAFGLIIILMVLLSTIPRYSKDEVEPFQVISDNATNPALKDIVPYNIFKDDHSDPVEQAFKRSEGV